MWNVYSLIKSGAINPQVWESPFDREMREAEEKVIDKIPQELNELESRLNELEKTSDKEKLWTIGHEINENERMACAYAIFGMASPKIKEYYERVIEALQRASEVLAKYSDLKLLSKFSRERKYHLIKVARECKSEVA